MKTRFPIVAAIACLAVPGIASAESQEIDQARERELTCSLVYKGVDCDAIFAAEDARDKAVIEGVELRAPPTVKELLALREARSGTGSSRPAAPAPSRLRPSNAGLANAGVARAPVGRGRSPSRPAGGAVQVAEDVSARANLFVTFRLGSAELETSARKDIDVLAAVIKKGAADGSPLRLRIAGHTDATGDDAVNEKLSADRAAAVRQALIEKGIAPDLLESTGYGSAQPIDGYAPTHGINRRVEAVVIE